MDPQWSKQWNEAHWTPVHGILRLDEYEAMQPLPEGSEVAVLPGMATPEEWEREVKTYREEHDGPPVD